MIPTFKIKILESITPEEFHFVEKIHQNFYEKSFDLIKKRHIQKFNELISMNKVTQGATNITDKKDLKKEEADTIHGKTSLTLQDSKPPKDNLSKDECKALKGLQSDISIIILLYDKNPRQLKALKDNKFVDKTY